MAATALAARTADKAPPGSGGGGWRELALAVPMAPVAVLLFLLMVVLVEGFASGANLANMARTAAPLLIAATGATFVFLLGGIDLSVGSTVSLASVAGALAMRATGSVSLGIAAGLAAGALVGLINGLAVARFRLVPFVHTLAMLLAARAVAFLLSEGRSIGRLPREALALGRHTVLGVPTIFLVALLVVALAWLVLARTPFGRWVHLAGDNRRAAVFNAVPVARVEFWVYLGAAVLAAAAGMIAVLRLGSGAPVLGDNLLLQVIAAVVIGGTSIHGGEGGVWRTATGVALVVMLDKGLNLMGLAFYDQWIAMGAIILLGSGLGAWLQRRRAG